MWVVLWSALGGEFRLVGFEGDLTRQWARFPWVRATPDDFEDDLTKQYVRFPWVQARPDDFETDLVTYEPETPGSQARANETEGVLTKQFRAGLTSQEEKTSDYNPVTSKQTRWVPGWPPHSPNWNSRWAGQAGRKIECVVQVGRSPTHQVQLSLPQSWCSCWLPRLSGIPFQLLGHCKATLLHLQTLQQYKGHIHKWDCM